MAKRTIASTNISIGLNLKGFKRGLGMAQKSLKQFGATATRIGQGISRNVTVPFAAAATAGVTMATKLESSFAKIENLVGITGDTLDRFKRGVKEVSSETAKSQQELSEALFTITSAGIRGAEALDVLEMAAKASSIGLGETREVAHALTGVLQAYADEGLTAARATDVLTAIVREGNLEASSLAPTLGRVVGIASQVGVSFEEVGANIATFTRLGVPAEEAVTGLRGVLNTILNPSKDAERVLASLGITASDLKARVGKEGLQSTLQFLLESFEGNDRAVATLFGNVRALSNVLGTAGAQGETYKEVLDNISNSTGIVDDGFENITEGSAFKFQKVLNELRNAAIDLGVTLLPLVTKITTFVTRAIQTFQSLSAETKTALLTIVAAVAAAGPIMSAIGFISSAIGALLSPVGLIIAGIAGAAFAIIKFWDKAKPIFVKIANAWIDAYNETLLFRLAIEGIAFVFKSMWDIVSVILSNFMGGLKNIGKLIIGIFSLDRKQIAEALSGMADGFTEVMGEIGDEVSKNWDEMMANMNPRKKIELVTEEGLQNAVDDFIDPIMGMWEKAKGLFTWKGTGGGASGEGTPAAVVKGAGEEAEKATPKVNKLAQAWNNFKNNVDLVNMTINELGGSLQSVFEEILLGTDRTFKEMALSVVESLKKMIAKLLAAAAAAAVLVTLLSAAGLGGMSMQTLKTFKSFAGAWKTMFGQLSGVALAKGGLAFGETLAVVGDNPNASMDPEVIAPLSKLKSMMGNMGGAQTVTVVGRLSGQDILLSTEKAGRTRSRYRGF